MRLKSNRIVNRVKSHRGEIIGKFVRYFVLAAIAYIFVLPLLKVFSTSIKNIYDQLNPLVIWFPESIYWENYRRAWIALGGTTTFFQSLRNIGLIALVQTISSAMIGYGMAKFNYWWTKLAFILMIILFVIPRELFLLPQYVMFSQQDMVNSLTPVVLLSAFGQGTKNAIYILIFYSFFRLQPKSLDEAAFVDGAGHIRTFLRINIPMAIPALIVSFIFSFVWNWNDTTVNGRFYGGRVTTVQLQLEQFGNLYNANFPYDTGSSPLEHMNHGIEMAGALLAILPLVIAYFFVQRYIVEGIDQSGITGE